MARTNATLPQWLTSILLAIMLAAGGWAVNQVSSTLHRIDERLLSLTVTTTRNQANIEQLQTRLLTISKE